MVPRGKASQAALGSGGDWTAGEEKGGDLSGKRRGGRDRPLWVYPPFRHLRVLWFGSGEGGQEGGRGRGGLLALVSRKPGRRRVRWMSGSHGCGYSLSG